MSQNLSLSRLSQISALLLIGGGIILFFMGYQNAFAPTFVIGALTCFWFSQKPPVQKLTTIGLVASIVGILFVAFIDLFPIFLEMRNSNPAFLPAAKLTWYFSGVIFFLGMILVLMSGFILLGISFLRSPSLPKASGVFFILGGIIAIDSNFAGPLLMLSGLTWLYAIIRQKKLAAAKAYLEYLSEE